MKLRIALAYLGWKSKINCPLKGEKRGKCFAQQLKHHWLGCQLPIPESLNSSAGSTSHSSFQLMSTLEGGKKWLKDLRGSLPPIWEGWLNSRLLSSWLLGALERWIIGRKISSSLLLPIYLPNTTKNKWNFPLLLPPGGAPFLEGLQYQVEACSGWGKFLLKLFKTSKTGGILQGLAAALQHWASGA